MPVDENVDSWKNDLLLQMGIANHKRLSHDLLLANIVEH